MYWQTREIKAHYNLPSNTATEIIDLPKSNFLSGLLIEYSWTRGASPGEGEQLEDTIDKIEIIANGSTEIFSMSGKEWLKYAHAETKKFPYGYRTGVSSEDESIVLPIMFGRSLYDNEYFLDCASFTSLELRLSYSPTIAAASYATSTGYLGVIGIMAMEGSPGSYKGYIKNSSKLTYTSAGGNVIKELELPRANLFRRIYVYAAKAATKPQAIISKVQLELNDGEKIPFVGRWQDIQAQNVQVFDYDTREVIRFEGRAADTVETLQGEIVEAQLTPIVDTATLTKLVDYYFSAITAGQLTIQGIQHAAFGDVVGSAYAVDEVYLIKTKGVSVGNLVCIDFDNENLMKTLLNSKSYDKVNLKLTDAGAGGKVYVILQEVIK